MGLLETQSSVFSASISSKWPITAALKDCSEPIKIEKIRGKVANTTRLIFAVSCRALPVLCEQLLHFSGWTNIEKNILNVPSFK